MLLIKDPGHFAIDSGLLYVVTTAVVGDLEDFEGEVFRLTLARESIRLAKFLIAGEPAEHRGFGRHPGVGTDRPKAFTVDEAVADRFGDLVIVRGWSAALGLVLVLHGSRLPVAALAQQRDQERTDTEREASLRGHLKAEGNEETGSQAYVPPDEKDDRALTEALDLLRGKIADAAFPPNPKTGAP